MPAFSADTTIDKRKDNIGSVIVFRGSGVIVYSGKNKTNLSSNDLPFVIYPGDEIEVGTGSDCQILVYGKENLYASEETLFSLSWASEDLATIWLRYGALMYKGLSPVSIKMNDFSAITTMGDVLVRYKRKTSEFVLFNMGAEFKYKFGDKEEFSALKTNKYIKAVAFSGKKLIGGIEPKATPKIYKLFTTTFRPEGKINTDENIPGIEAGTDTTKFKQVDEANIDHVKRSIGI